MSLKNLEGTVCLNSRLICKQNKIYMRKSGKQRKLEKQNRIVSELIKLSSFVIVD